MTAVSSNASWLVTDRSGGASQGVYTSNNLALHVGDDPVHVAGNRRAAAEEIGADALVFATAAHSNRVGYVPGPADDVPGVDALITDHVGVAVAAQGADCVMVGLAAGTWVAALHCGWKGLVAGIVPATIRELTARGADLTAASARLGPCICGACYTVDEARSQQVAQVVPEAVSQAGGTPTVDLRAGVVAQLAEAGISATVDTRCTAEDPHLFSYRRDGVTGRQAMIVMRNA